MRGVLVLPVALALVACGGGGSDSPDIVPAGVAVVPFTTVSAIEPDQVVDFPTGVARMVLTDPRDDGSVRDYTGAGWFSISIRARFDEAAELEAIQIRGRGVTFDAGEATTSVKRFAADERYLALVRSSAALTDSFIVSDPDAFALAHHLFGAWQDPIAISSSVRLGLFGGSAFGVVTEVAVVPQAGSASYRGGSIGIVVDADGGTEAISADVTLDADFGSQALAFASANARALASGEPRPALATSGALVIAGDGFSGTGTAANGWGGPIAGRFFGPAAEEAGGVLDLTGAGVERYLAAFGSRR